jgi:hypothetical protein
MNFRGFHDRTPTDIENNSIEVGMDLLGVAKGWQIPYRINFFWIWKGKYQKQKLNRDKTR